MALHRFLRLRESLDRRAAWALAWAACVALLGGLYGATELIGVLRQSEPLVIDLATYERERPAATWLRIPDGTLDWPVCVSARAARGGKARVFVPLRPADWEPPPDRSAQRTPIHVVVETERSTDVFRAERVRERRTGSGPASTTIERRSVQGLVRFGAYGDTAAVAALADRWPELRPDCVVLLLDARPSTVFALVFLGTAAAGGAMVYLIVRRPSRRGVPGLRSRRAARAARSEAPSFTRGDRE